MHEEFGILRAFLCVFSVSLQRELCSSFPVNNPEQVVLVFYLDGGFVRGGIGFAVCN